MQQPASSPTPATNLSNDPTPQATLQTLSKHSLTDTAALVATFRQTDLSSGVYRDLGHFFGGYARWLQSQSLPIVPQGTLQEYAQLARVAHQSKHTTQMQERLHTLLTHHLAVLINKIPEEYRVGEEEIFQALSETLPWLPAALLKAQRQQLLELCKILSARLARLHNDDMNQNSYQTHRHTFEAFHSALAAFRISLQEDRLNRDEGAYYDLFKLVLRALEERLEKVKVHGFSTRNIDPALTAYQCQITRALQCLKRLKDKADTEEKTGKIKDRLSKGVKPFFTLLKGALKRDLDALIDTKDDLREVVKINKKIDLQDWYNDLTKLAALGRATLMDDKAWPNFNAQLQLLAKEAWSSKEDRISFRYGLITQLKYLAEQSSSRAVQQACKQYLSGALCELPGWGATDPGLKELLRTEAQALKTPAARSKALFKAVRTRHQEEVDKAKMRAQVAAIYQELQSLGVTLEGELKTLTASQSQDLPQLQAHQRWLQAQLAKLKEGSLTKAILQEELKAAFATYLSEDALVKRITSTVSQALKATQADKAQQPSLTKELEQVEQRLKNHTDAQSKTLLQEFHRLHQALTPIARSLHRLEQGQEQGSYKTEEVLKTLQEAFAQPELPQEMQKVRNTPALIAALNSPDHKHFQTLKHYADYYNVYFAQQEVTALTPQQVLEYATLARLKASGSDTQALQRLVKTYVGSWIAKLRHCQNPQKTVELLQGVTQMMAELDLSAFAGDPTLLTNLAQTVLAQLPDSQDRYTRHTHASHSHALRALNAVMAGVAAVSPDKWTFDEKNGLYEQFNKKIEVITASQYGPFIYESILLKQHLQALKKPLTMYQKGKYTFQGFMGLGQMVLGLANVFDWQIEGSQLTEGSTNVWQALQAWEIPDVFTKNLRGWIKRLRGTRELSYEDLAQLSYTALCTLRDPQTYATSFDEVLALLKEQSRQTQDETKRQTLHQAMVAQLTTLASVDTQGDAVLSQALQKVRANAQQELQLLLEEAVAHKSETLVKQVLEGLAQVAKATTDGSQARIRATLDKAWQKVQVRFAAEDDVHRWLASFQATYRALRATGLTIWARLGGERTKTGQPGSLFECVEADLLRQHNALKRGVAYRVISSRLEEKQQAPISLPFVQQVVSRVQATAKLPQTTALSLASYGTSAAEQALRAKLELWQQRWTQQRTLDQKEQARWHQALQGYGRDIQTLQQTVQTLSQTNAAQYEDSTALLHKLAKENNQATERLAKLLAAQQVATGRISEKLDVQHAAALQRTTEAEQNLSSQIAASHQLNEAQLTELKELRTLYTSLKDSIRQLVPQRAVSTAIQPSGELEATLQRVAGRDYARSTQKFTDGIQSVDQAVAREQEGDYGRALKKYREAISDFEQAEGFLSKALRRAKRSTKLKGSPMQQEWEKKLTYIQNVLRQLNAYIGKHDQQGGVGLSSECLSVWKQLLLKASAEKKE